MPVAKTASVRTTSAATNLAKTLQDIYMASKFVTFLRKNTLAARFATEEILPAHSGKNVRWLFHNALAIPSGALAEGDDPSDSRATSINFVEAAMATWGDYIEFTEELQDYSHGDLMGELSELAAQQAKETIDTQILTELITTTTSRDTGAALTLDQIRLASLDLQKNNALPNKKSSDGGSFVCIFSPEQFEDLRGEGNPSFYQVKGAAPNSNSQNGSYRGPAQPRDCGYGMEIYVTTNIVVDTAPAPDNDQGVIIADNAFGVSSFQTNIMQPSVNVLQPTPSLASPLGRRGLVTWKAKFVPKLFDSKRVEKILSDVTGT